MLNGIISFLFLFHFTLSTIKLQSSYVKVGNAQSGILSPVSPTTTGNDISMKYNIVFTKTYSVTPNIALALHSYFFCPSSFGASTIMAIQNASASNGQQFTMTILDFSLSSDNNFLIKFNYFVVDGACQGFAIRNAQVTTTTRNSTGKLNFVKQLINGYGFIYCYMINLLIMKASATTSNDVDLTCNITYTAQVTYNITSINDHETYNLYVYVVAVYPDPTYLKLSEGFFTPSSTAEKSISSVIVQPQKNYFIGMNARHMLTQCVKVGLDANNIQVSANSAISFVNYTYFITTFNYTYPEKFDVSFDYRGLENRFTIIMLNFKYGLWKFRFLWQTQFENQFTYITVAADYIMFGIKPDAILPTQSFNFSYQARSSVFDFQCNFSAKIVPNDLMIMNANDNSIELRILNAHPSTNQSHFTSDSRTSWKNFTRYSDGTIYMILNFQSVLSGAYLYTYYNNTMSPTTDENFYYQSIMFNVNYILSETYRNSVSVKTILHYYWNGDSHLSFKCDSTHISSHSFSPGVAQIMTSNFQTQQDSWKYPIQYSSVPNSQKIYKFMLRFTLVTIIETSTNVTTNETKVVIVNSLGFQEIQSKYFVFDLIGPVFKSMTYNFTHVEMIVDTTNYDGGTYIMSYVVPNVYFQPQITTNFYVFKSWVYEDRKNKLNFTFKNTAAGIDPNNMTVTLNIPSIIIQRIEINSTDMILVCEFFTYINKEKLIIQFPYPSPIYTQKVYLTLETDIEIIYCPFQEEFISRSSIVKKGSMILAGLYLATFVCAILSCQKMYGIELMFVIQFAYYSLIPINVICYPFFGLEQLRYASGATTFFGNLLGIQSEQLPNNYSSLKIQSNFISNVNILLIALFILPFVYFPLNHISNTSKDYKIKPRCMKYSKSFLCQIPFTVILFSAFCISISFTINLQTYMMSDIVATLFSIVCLLLFPLSFVLFFKYKDHFSEYNNQFNKTQTIYKLSKYKVVQIRGAYPLIMILQMTLVPIILSIEAMKEYGFYVILVIELVIFVYVAVFPLYELRLDNVRNYVHRVIVVMMVALQTITLIIKQGNPSTDSLVFYSPLALLGLLSLQFLTTGSYIIYKSIQFWRSPGLIDDALRIKQCNMKSRPSQQNTPPRSSSVWIPRNWYQIKKQVKADRMRQKSQNDSLTTKLLTPSQKYQMWFNEIGERRYYRVLGVNEKKYELLKNRKDFVWAEKQEWIKEKLMLANVDDILERYPNAVNTLGDLMEFLDKELLKRIKKRNQMEERG